MALTKRQKQWLLFLGFLLVVGLALGLGLGLGLKPEAFGNMTTADIENAIVTYINNQPDPNFYNYQVFLALKGYKYNGLYSKANYDKLYSLSEVRPLTLADLNNYKGA
jgi:hypothetical protein